MDHREFLKGKPSVKSDYCCICGRPATNQHHIVPKGMGGTSNPGPTISVCGFGNNENEGCHGLLHSGLLFLDWDEDGQCWMYLRAKEPMKDWQAWDRDEHPLEEWVRIWA